jgi:hypothetical protein
MIDTFWKWLARGTAKSVPGWRNLINWFLVIHIGVAAVATLAVKADPFEFAKTALFPAASILVGMSLAWTTRAATVLQTAELRARLFDEERPAEDYIYGYQLAILVIIVMVAYVAVMAGGGLNVAVFGAPIDQYLSGFFLYLLLSMSLRECWGAVNFTNMLSLLDFRRPQSTKPASRAPRKTSAKTSKDTRRRLRDL